MQVKWLRKALQDLDREAAYIAEDNPRAAEAVIQQIVETVNLLPENPSLGHPGRIHRTRELVIAGTSHVEGW